MGPKPKKLTKKQEQELLEKRKLEEKQEKLRQLERQKQEEERRKKIEAKNNKIKDDLIEYQEDKERLEKEEKKIRPEKKKNEELVKKVFNEIYDENEWKCYSNCKRGYINIRKEREVTSFIYSFEERLNIPLYINCVFIEKNIPEELSYFINILNHQKSFQKLYIESIASREILIPKDYSKNYMKKLLSLTNKKMEYLTIYFLENFEKLGDMHKNPSKYKLGQNSVEKTTNNFSDMCIEWVDSTSKVYRIGYWCNNIGTSREAVIGNFKYIPCKIQYLPNQCVSNTSIIRFVYSEIDEREYIQNDYFPYITINGIFKLTFLNYPQKTIAHKTWEMKEIIGDSESYIQSLAKETFGQQIRMTVTISIDEKVFLSDLNEKKGLVFGRYNEDSQSWLIDEDNIVTLDKELRTAIFKDYSEINTFTLLLNKKHLYPYKSWYFRSVLSQKEILNIKNNKKELKTLYVGKLDLESK